MKEIIAESFSSSSNYNIQLWPMLFCVIEKLIMFFHVLINLYTSREILLIRWFQILKLLKQLLTCILDETEDSNKISQPLQGRSYASM